MRGLTRGRRRRTAGRLAARFEALEARHVLDSVVVINEIHYNPAGLDETLEWVELKNMLATDVDLSRWRLTDGIDFTFVNGTTIPANGYLVVAANPAALQAATGFAGALGPYVGSLSNGGEEIDLVNNGDRQMDSVNYGDNGGWPVGPDGSGATLAKVDEDWAGPGGSNWRTSLQLGGTPGATNFPVADLTPRTTNPVTLTSSWRYHDGGVDLGTSWRAPNFVDTAWNQGPAVFHAGTDPAQPALGLRFLPISNDADSGINSSKAYTHKVDFGGVDTGAVINGVTFSQGTTGTFGSIPGFALTQSGGIQSTSCPNAASSNVTGGLVQLFQDSMCNVVNPANGTVTITLSNLTVGAHYDTRLYTRQPTTVGPRNTNVQFDTNVDGTPESTSLIDQTNAAATPPGFATANQAYAISYDFIATNTSMRIRLVQPTASTPWVLYGLTNEAVGAVAFPQNVATLFSTGLGNDGLPLSAGAVDPHWTFVPPTQPVLAMVNHPAWLANSQASQWVGLTANGVDNVPPLTYSLQTQFDLSTYDVSTLQFSLQAAVDNSLDSVFVNGVSAGISTAGFGAFLGPFTIPANRFVPGMNTLVFNFTNAPPGDNPGGLRVQFNATATPQLLRTPVAQGPNTHYFRKEFQFTGDPLAQHELELNMLVDDGAVFYLNGQEIYRRNMPAGPVTYATAAASDMIGATLTGRIPVPAGALAIGRNVLAVEVHQFSPAANDVRFGAEAFIRETPVAPSDLPQVVLNELAAGGDPNFFVELRNVDTDPANVAGWTVRVVGATTWDYVIPGGTTLSPGELLHIPRAQLGYDAALDDHVFLFMAGGQTVIDARTLTTRVRGLAAGHGDDWLWPAVATPGTANQFALQEDVVINEIMYHHAPRYETPFVPGQYNTTMLLPTSGTWRYNDRGQSLPGNWSQSVHAVDNVNWRSGQGLMGFDADPQPDTIRTTFTNPVNNNPFIVTYYFETEFNFSDNLADPNVELVLRHIIDDGAVFYLNGFEVLRFNMPATSSATTLASTTLTNAADITGVVLPKDQLVVGSNRLSVEVHQSSLSSSDIVFGAELTQRTLITPPMPGQPYAPSDEEWVELHNKSASDVVLTGWKLRGGLNYDFPLGTTIPAGGYLVVSNNRAALAAKYPTIAATIIGDFSGTLSNHDDEIRLEDPSDNPADEVHYYGGNGRWADLPDGGGSSLELRDPDADNSQAEAWAASATPTAPWQTITYRGPASPFSGTNDPANWHEFLFGLLNAGEMLIDDISVIEDPSGTALQRVQNGNFEGVASIWRLLGNHGQHGLSAVILDPDNAANHVLKVVATGTTEPMGNHVVSTLSSPIVAGREYEISFRARWLSGSPQLNTRLYFNRLARTTILPVPQTLGTPGAVNSRRVANVGPTYDTFQHSPVIPQVAQPITVSAVAADPDGVTTMNVKYSVNGAAFATAAMTLASDGVWRGTIPGQSASAIVQFYVEGTDGLAAISTFPAAGPNSRALFKVNDSAGILNNRHNFRIVMTNADATFMHQETTAQSNDRLGGTVIFKEGQVYYDVGIRVKGSGYSRGTTSTGYNMQFAPERPLLGVHEVSAIDRNGGPYGLGASHRELVIKHIANQVGNVPGMYDDVLNFIAPLPAYNSSGQLMGARYEDDFLGNEFDTDGTRFKFDLIYYNTTGSGAVIHPRPNTVLGVDIQNMGSDENAYRWNWLIRNNRAQDDFSRIIELGQTLSLSGSTVGSQLDVRSRQVIDVDQWLRVFAYESLAGINDTYNMGLPHNIQFFVRSDNGLVEALPWDSDFALHHGTNISIYGTGSNFRKVIDIPTNQRVFQGHLLDMINTTYNTTYLTPWVNHIGTRAVSNVSATILQYITDRRAFVLSQLMPNVPFTITTNAGTDFGVTTGSVVLEGNGWIDVRDIRLAGNTSPLTVTWLDQDSWRITVPLRTGANPISLQAYNHQGQLVGSDTITVTTTTSAPNPVDHLRITEVMYHPTDPTQAEFDAGFTDADEFEYLEFQNISDGVLDLTGVHFTDGVEFDFTGSAVTSLGPGEYAIITENTAAFNHRYGNPNVRIAGQFTGRLGNGGEHLRLEDVAGSQILDFTYDDAGPTWHPTTDGLGPSLVIVDPLGATANWNLGVGWRPSFLPAGSPGAKDFMDGDFNMDNRVGVHDLGILQNHFGFESGVDRSNGDLTADGIVARIDVVRFLQNYAAQYDPPPPPAPAASPAVAVVLPTPHPTAASSEPPKLSATRTRLPRPRLPAAAVDEVWSASANETPPPARRSAARNATLSTTRTPTFRGLEN